jgi:pimeloyl-ACP methyl ester carboxylesterase
MMGAVIADERLWVQRGGPDDGPLVVLLHGLGHTAEVWRGLIELLPGGWLALDLPGHWRSPWVGEYTFDRVAASVATVLPHTRPVRLIGHSFGGAVALALAAIRPEVHGVLGFGIKVVWSDEELATMKARAARPPRVFAGEGEALAMFVRFGGLHGIVDSDSALARSGITEVEGGYRLATDPATMAVGAPDMPALLAGARAGAHVVLACGEHDHMVSAEQLRALDPGAVVVPGVGHNFHLTHPQRLAEIATVGDGL